MKKIQKDRVEEILKMLDQVHGQIGKSLACGDAQTAAVCLESCQNTAIKIGGIIEESEGENTETVGLLEDYCEMIFNLHEAIMSGKAVTPARIKEMLDEHQRAIEASFRNSIPVVREAVFLPYKASMWDSLESLWRKYNADPQWTAQVIPIPYYDKNPDGSFQKLHYEGDQYPDDVPIVHYESYDFENNHPDIIFIHNPYDEYNIVTSVHPFFYSSNLKKLTDKLVYVPYFVLAEPDPGNAEALKAIEHFVRIPGVYNADEVIVQSENMRKCYIEILVMASGEESRQRWEQKIKGDGSPKFDRVANTDRDMLDMPQDWKNIIFRSDGTRKKVVLYNTSVTALLQESEKMLAKIEDVLKIFRTEQDKVALLWRPHPLMEATIRSMRPQLWEEYNRIVENYTAENWGIYDDSADLDRAIALADAYYGDASSVVQLCQSVGKPVMIQNVDVMS